MATLLDRISIDPAVCGAGHDVLTVEPRLRASGSVAGELWIVEPGRARVHLERDET